MGFGPRGAKVDEAEGSPSRGGANRQPGRPTGRSQPGKSKDQRKPSGWAITRSSFPPRKQTVRTTLPGDRASQKRIGWQSRSAGSRVRIQEARER